MSPHSAEVRCAILAAYHAQLQLRFSASVPPCAALRLPPERALRLPLLSSSPAHSVGPPAVSFHLHLTHRLSSTRRSSLPLFSPLPSAMCLPVVSAAPGEASAPSRGSYEALPSSHPSSTPLTSLTSRPRVESASSSASAPPSPVAAAPALSEEDWLKAEAREAELLRLKGRLQRERERRRTEDIGHLDSLAFHITSLWKAEPQQEASSRAHMPAGLSLHSLPPSKRPPPASTRSAFGSGSSHLLNPSILPSPLQLQLQAASEPTAEEEEEEEKQRPAGSEDVRNSSSSSGMGEPSAAAAPSRAPTRVELLA